MKMTVTFLPGEPFLVTLRAATGPGRSWTREFMDKETAAIAGSRCGYAQVWEGTGGSPCFTFRKDCDVEPSALWEAGFRKSP